MKPTQRAYLIAGAGAIGQVFGAHLAQNGNRVYFLVKAEHKEDLEKNGITIVNPDNGKRVILEEPQLIVENEPLDKNLNAIVLLCVRSEQLDSTFSFLKTVPQPWPIVCLQPGFEDLHRLKAALPGRTFLQGNPGISAFFSNGSILNKTSRYFPTLIEETKQSKNNLAKQIVDDLNAAKIPARLTPSVAREIQPLFAFATAFLLGLEYHGFHLISLLSDHKIFSLSHQAAKESAAVICQVHEIKPARRDKLLFRLPTMMIRILMQLTLAAPESHQYQMWSHHAPKIRKQSLAMAENIRALGEKHALPIANLKKLIQLIQKLNQSAETSEPVKVDTLPPPIQIRTETKR